MLWLPNSTELKIGIKECRSFADSFKFCNLGWMGILPDKDYYRMYWRDAEQFTNLTYTATAYAFEAGDYIVIQHKLLQKPDV